MRLVCPVEAYLTAVYFASQFAKSGGKVRLQNYLAMPHVFQMFLKHPSTKTCFREFAKFINDVTNGKSIETEFQIVNGRGIIEDVPLKIEGYQISFTTEEVLLFLMLLTTVTETNGIRSITTIRNAQTQTQTIAITIAFTLEPNIDIEQMYNITSRI